MYDTQKRVALAKERIAESRRRQARRSIRSLSALCALLFLSLLGTVGTVQSQPMDAAGMYGAILLHEGVGGYVLEAVISFTAAVVLTALYIKFRKRKQTPWKWGKINEKARKTKETKRTDLCGAALHLYDAFFSFCACIGGRNEKRSGQP